MYVVIIWLKLVLEFYKPYAYSYKKYCVIMFSDKTTNPACYVAD